VSEIEQLSLYLISKIVYDIEHFYIRSTLLNTQGIKQQGSVLIVDDDEDILVAGKLLLKRNFTSVTTCNRPESIPTLMSEQQFDVIMLDMNFGPGESSGTQGFLWLEKILEIDPQAVVIMITAHSGVNIAVEAMKMGATDFIAKPWQNEKVVATLSSAVKLGKTRIEAKELRNTNQLLAKVTSSTHGRQLIGNSAAMSKVHSLIERTAPTDANVLILGENGTGKELVARELHTQSHRSENVFMTVDLGAISESLFESELFGHKKGAFTDARDNRIGRLKAADGGTLFLDEIGNLPLHLQTKLLSVLEQRMVTPIGSNSAVAFDVRVVAATNVSRKDLADEKKFRQDLLFRLNTVEIELPPLRDRAEDIKAIARHYIDFYCRKYGKEIKSLSADALIAMSNYPWPGNVRALRHAIERAVILSETAQFEAIDFQLQSHDKSANQQTEPASDINSDSNSGDKDETNADLNLDRLEKTTIESALRKHRYNISHSAKDLGLTRAALYRRMEKYGF